MTPPFVRAWISVALACAACASPPVAQDTDVAAHVLFDFPVVERDRISDLIGVDHDPEPGVGGLQCLDYLGQSFPHCYDGHKGSDYKLVGGFETMDAGSATVVAAAPGVVIETHDGEYDRCQADLAVEGGIRCDGAPPIAANSVVIEHEGGTLSRYWHLKSGSVAVAVGDPVQRGDRLGLIGSSGISSFPHLHFEVLSADGAVVDPYAGPYSQDDSWWCSQQPPDVLPAPCD